jgi:guanine deaminase
MCAALCSFTGVSRIVYGVSVADLADLGVPQIELSCEEVVSRGPAKPDVRGGVLRDACLAHCRTRTLAE